MTAFIVIAVLLGLGATATLVVPLLKPRADGTRPAAIAAVACVVLVAGGAAILYPVWSTWSWKEPVADGTPEAMVGSLARRLERQPEDLEGWLLLGRSYAQLGQFPLSARAYRRADRLAEGRSAEAATGLGEALLLAEQSDLKGEAGRLFERAVELDPNSTKALFYSAVGALDRGDRGLARQRFERLLTGNPPPEVRNLIQRQIDAIDAGLVAGGQPEQPGGSAQGETVAATVRVRVTLAPAVASAARAGAPLFVSVRLAGQGGPPLAARRLEAKFPQELELGAGDAMIAGRALSAGQDVEITARVANGGTATASSGDPFGTVRHTVGGRTDEPLDLVIDRLTP